MFETMTSAFIDEFPRYLKSKKMLVTATLCFVEFLLGIPCITQGGVYFLQIMDWYSATFSLMILSFTELIVISWIYGAERFYKDIELMIGHRPCIWWKICWRFITPAIILFVLLFSIVVHTPVSYGEYQYPGWAVGVGWFFALCSIAPLPLVAIVKILMEEGTFIERIKKLVRPSPEWGPALDRHREMYIASLKSDSQTAMEVTASLRSDKYSFEEDITNAEAEATEMDHCPV